MVFSIIKFNFYFIVKAECDWNISLVVDSGDELSIRSYSSGTTKIDYNNISPSNKEGRELLLVLTSL